jgi:FlaA1/EpsC-like NDP-sugar epimerase
MIELYLAVAVLVPALFLVFIEVVMTPLSKRNKRPGLRGRPVRFRIVDAVNRRSRRKKSIKGEIQQRSYILVIGGCNYVGQQLVKLLVRQPDTNIRVFDRRLLPPSDRHPEVTYYTGDLCNTDHIQASLHGVSVLILLPLSTNESYPIPVQIVFHVGAIRSLVGLSKSVLWEANVMATQNVLEQCLKKNVVRQTLFGTLPFLR